MIKTQKKKIHLLPLPFLTKNQFSDGRSFFFLVNNEKSGKKFYTEDHFVLNYDAYSPVTGSGTYYNEEYTSFNKKDEAFSAPVYKLFSETERECFSKAIIETSSKTVILNDKPAFVHLVTACADYGKDIVKWERFGDFYDECVIDPDVTGQVLNTYEPDLSKVPEGDYYVIIAWFADGSCDISSVRKK